MPLTPEERRLRGQLAVNQSWAKTDDRAARTEPARRAMLECFEQQVDPDGVLEPAERARRAEYLRKAHFQRMALASSKARRARAGARAAGKATSDEAAS